MNITLATNFLLVLIIIEISKSIVANNYFINKLFFPVIKKSRNKKEILNWLFNLFFFLTIISIILISIIYFFIFIFNKNLLFLFLLSLVPLIISNSFFFLIKKNLLQKNKYTTIKLKTLFLYTMLFIIFYNFRNYNLVLLGFISITLLEIIKTYFLFRNKLNFNININYLNDFRNYYFVKKFIRFIFKSQTTKIFLLIILIISGSYLITF